LISIKEVLPVVPISELCDEHRQLAAQAERLREIVRRPVPDTASIAAMRWQMAQALYNHCAHEDQEIYQLIFASGDAAATRVAWAYRQEHGRIGRAFGQYVTDWPVARINREWDIFRAETLAILDRLAVRMIGEEASLYAHAVRVRLRRAA
jgi:hypothetical protein